MTPTIKITGFEELFNGIKLLQDEVNFLKKEITTLKKLLTPNLIGDNTELTKKDIIKIMKWKNPVTVNNKVNLGEFPPPDKKINNKPIWRAKTIKEFLKKTNQFHKWIEWEKKLICT